MTQVWEEQLKSIEEEYPRESRRCPYCRDYFLPEDDERYCSGTCKKCHEEEENNGY
jgi:hypothetical protein